MKRTKIQHRQHRIKVKLRLCEGVTREWVVENLRAATEDFWRDMESWSAARHNDVQFINETQTLVLPFNKYSSPGRPRKDELRTYIKRLISIYEHATDELGKRSVPNPSTKAIQERARTGKTLIRDKEKLEPGLHAFLLACLGASSIRSYGTVAQILHELHPDAKRGRPKKARAEDD